MITLRTNRIVVRKQHTCTDCGRPICRTESCIKVVLLEYVANARKHHVWSEYSCCAKGAR